MLLVGVRTASAHTPPPTYALERPRLEVSSWIGLGGGALTTEGRTRGVFDLRVGFDFTAALSASGDVRIGPYIELGSSAFASIGGVGGVELFFGAAPSDLRMFYYSGEGTLLFRLGAGWTWSSDLNAPVASLTVAYGYRAPFSLTEYSEQTSDEDGQRDAARYMVGVRLWVNGTVGFGDSSLWQLTGGLEFEPVGTFRYLFGLY